MKFHVTRHVQYISFNYDTINGILTLIRYIDLFFGLFDILTTPTFTTQRLRYISTPWTDITVCVYQKDHRLACVFCFKWKMTVKLQ